MSYSPMTESMKDSVYQDIYGTRQTICVGIVGFTILVWDHIVTSADEIELIWRRPKRAVVVYLFLLNRYLIPLVFIVNLVAYNLPSWGYISCQQFVVYEGATTAAGIEIVGVMMLLRAVAIYKHQWAAIAPAGFLLLAWIAVTTWLLCHGEPVPHTNYVHSCSMVFNSGSIASASAWLPLLYDTYIFGLTLNRTLPSIRNKEAGHVIHTLFADGLLYYSVICTINLVLTIMIVRAGMGVKNIAAQLELLLTVTMMSRITLNLRKQAFHRPNPHQSQAENIVMSTRDNVICTPQEGAVVLSQLRSRSVSSAARVESSTGDVRSGSASSIVSPTRTITFAENPSIPTIRPRLNTMFSAANTPITLSFIGSPLSEHVDWPSAAASSEIL